MRAVKPLFMVLSSSPRLVASRPSCIVIMASEMRYVDGIPVVPAMLLASAASTDFG